MRINVARRNPAAEAFRLANAPTLSTRVLRKSAVSVTELRCDKPNFGRTASMSTEAAYLIALQLRACHDHDLFFDGRHVQPKNYFAGVTSIYDLRQDPVADIRDPYHCVMFHLPQKAIDAVAYEAGVPGITELRHELGLSMDDPVVRHLISSLLPAIANPEEAHPLFLDHIALALIVHVSHTYGGMKAAGTSRGGLAPWQVQRATELINDTLEDQVSLTRLAHECGLSVRHFARAFRESTGLSPHRWLLRRRVDHARELLGNRALSLSEIALLCGFADQSHFTRVFTNALGISPGAWRRANYKG